MVPGPEEVPHPFRRPPRAGAVPLVAPGELARLLDGPEPPLLLDVRRPAERALARFPGDVAIPLAELPRRLAEVPVHRPAVVYDQFGADARRAVDFLRGSGRPLAAALEGGIDEYARVVDPAIPRYRVEPETVVLRPFPRPATGCLAYLVADPVEHVAAIVDPGPDVSPYLEILRLEDWTLRAVVETHTHADHLAGHASLHVRTDAPICVGRNSPARYPHRSLGEGEAVPVGREELVVLETPGHTRDHLTLRLRDKIFTGDTLLVGGCGRTDLGDGDPGLLWESLTGKILRLPDETEVHPAHFGPRHALADRYSSSLGFERGSNEALRQPDRAAFLTYMTEGWPPKPADFDAIVRANLADLSGAR